MYEPSHEDIDDMAAVGNQIAQLLAEVSRLRQHRELLAYCRRAVEPTAQILMTLHHWLCPILLHCSLILVGLLLHFPITLEHPYCDL